MRNSTCRVQQLEALGTVAFGTFPFMVFFGVACLCLADGHRGSWFSRSRGAMLSLRIVFYAPNVVTGSPLMDHVCYIISSSLPFTTFSW